MIYSNQYRNQEWLYTVYGSNDGKSYILSAIVPAVGWYEIALELEEKEVNILKESEDKFTDFVNKFLKQKDLKKFSQRRIERKIKRVDTDTIRYEK